MATYNIDGPDGKTYSIDGPEGATREQVIAKIQQRLGEQGHDRGTLDKLFGLTGERYQTWPEKFVRGVGDAFEGGAGMVKKAETGQYGAPGSREFTANIIPDATKSAMLGVTGAPGASEALGLTSRNLAERKAISSAMPSKEAIKDSATASYKAIEKARFTVKPNVLDDAISNIKADLDADLIPEISAPRTFLALNKLQKAGGDINQIMGIRQSLGAIKPSEGTDFAAASHAIDAIDGFLEGITPQQILTKDKNVDPQYVVELLNHARSSWRAYKKLDQVDRAMLYAQHRAASTGTGANLQNTMRQEIRKILDSDTKSRGYSEQAKRQMEEIVEGTRASNIARFIGKFAPSGPVSAWTSIMAGLEAGPGVGTAVGVGATLARKLGSYLTRKQIQELANVIRGESPLSRAAIKGVKDAPKAPIGEMSALPAMVGSAGTSLPSMIREKEGSLPEVLNYDPNRT